nr:lysine-specific demethylase 5D isoform X1 [Tanacetum cinerariifolium]
MKDELLRVYNKEKSWRERLWKNGIIRSLPMAPKTQPNYVGVEEDATCIICQQFLYLSAVGCSCRPSAFVCLEHWENLCECKPRKRHFRYRHTLAELNDMVVMMDKPSSEEMNEKRNTRANESPSLSKKVKGGHVTITQLAEEWLLRSCKILQLPYSNNAYTNWAEGVRECLSKIESWASRHNSDVERVKMEDVSSLINISHVPCNEPGHLKLKAYEEEARGLIQEIRSALPTCSNIDDLETLCHKASESAIYSKEIEELSTKVTSVKQWLHTVRNCISEKSTGVIEVDIVANLKSEITQLQLQVPEVSVFLDFATQVETCQSRCTEMSKGSITLKVGNLVISGIGGFK